MDPNQHALVLKSSVNFSCKICDYETSRHSQYVRHLSTSKHELRIKMNALEQVNINKEKFKCKFCNKIYKARNSLWYHEKKCNLINNSSNIEEKNPPEELKNLTTMMIELIKSNTDMQKQMLDMFKNNAINVTNNNIHSNSHNKTFNLHFFLNEQCKDAMNISDFANSFELQLSDLESVGELGYVEGITKIMVDKLNSMDIYKRPIHCSDAKREILYVKDDNKWAKEERNNPKLRYAIKTISFRNMKLAALWSDTYPESQNGESHLSDTYLKIIKESTGGNGELSFSEDKIIRRIAKEILIDKN
jgi:hypothetical protein